MNEEIEEPVFDETEPQCVLPTEYNHCIIGHTFGVGDIPRFAYSLNALADHEHAKTLADFKMADPEDARKAVWEIVMDITGRLGPRAPIFIDDSAFRQNKTPKLWVPGGN